MASYIVSIPERERDTFTCITKTKRKEERETEKKERRATQIICINCSTQHTHTHTSAAGANDDDGAPFAPFIKFSSSLFLSTSSQRLMATSDMVPHTHTHTQSQYRHTNTHARLSVRSISLIYTASSLTALSHYSASNKQTNRQYNAIVEGR